MNRVNRSPEGQAAYDSLSDQGKAIADILYEGLNRECSYDGCGGKVFAHDRCTRHELLAIYDRKEDRGGV